MPTFNICYYTHFSKCINKNNFALIFIIFFNQENALFCLISAVFAAFCFNSKYRHFDLKI